MCKEAIDAVLDLEKMGLPFNRTPEGRIDQRRFGGHTRQHGEAPVRRSCFAADRTGHMILQTLYQQCIKQNVDFFNEFYVLDLLMTDGRASGVVAYELATGEIHVFSGKAVVLATGGFGKVFRTTSNAHTLDRRRHGHRLAQGPAAGGHGVLPVPPHRPGRSRRTAVRGRPRRGRHPPQQGRRALHGALRADHQGPRAARHGRPGDGQRGPRGSRLRPGRALRLPRPDAPRAQAHRREAPRHHRVRPHLSRRRALQRADPGLPHRALRDGRRADQHQGRGAVQQRRRRPRPVRRRRGRLRVGARRQPARHQLAARHQRVRSPGRRQRCDVRADASSTSSCPTSRPRS